MTDKTQAALKLALEALESGKNHGVAIDVLRRVLAEQLAQQQEPVAWTSWRELAGARHYGTSGWVMHAHKRSDEDIPLYTSPQSKPWVGLTGEEVTDIADSSDCLLDIVILTQDKLRGKNA